MGHWAPGSVMMEHYDRAQCATELRLRGDILERVRNQGWAPAGSFEVPAPPQRTGGESQEVVCPVQTKSCTKDDALTACSQEKGHTPCDTAGENKTSCETTGISPPFDKAESDDETSLGTDVEEAEFSEVDISDLYARGEFAYVPCLRIAFARVNSVREWLSVTSSTIISPPRICLFWKPQGNGALLGASLA